MFLGFINTRISIKHLLLSLSLPLLFYQPLSFWGKTYPLPFLENKHNSNPHFVCNVGEIQLSLIKTNCFRYLLLQIKPVIIKTFAFKFENVAFIALPKKIIMIRHNKVYNIIEFLLIFIISFYFEELYSDTA